MSAIVSPLSWGSPIGESGWAHIINHIARGETFSLWSGYFYERPNWREGVVSLRVKVGKKRKLVRGRLWLDSNGHDAEDELYSFEFKPIKPRILTRHLHPALYEYINDRKAGQYL